jgi:quinone-modifying oxidoreductase subunit QmoC
MATALETVQETAEVRPQASPQIAPAASGNGQPVWLEPDVDFIRRLSQHGAGTFKKCMQCGTCSATCALSPDLQPFPRKEMAWAAWGLRDRLLKDPDVWLCHQCNDCSTRCPCGARPGDLLAAVRQESIRHYAVPRFLGRWVNHPKYIPPLLAIPAVLLGLALLVKEPVEKALGISTQPGEKIVYSYSSVFPHWVLNSFFLFFGLLVFLAALAGVVRFWRAMQTAPPWDGMPKSAKPLLASILSALKGIIAHSNFSSCTQANSRFLSHVSVFFGFIALSVVTLWVITARFNPLIPSDFVYPFSFWSPWKLLANVGGAALLAGCLLMIRDRFRNRDVAVVGTYFDWALLVTLLAVVGTGFLTELLHYARLVPHRHIAYFIHLVCVFALLMYLPYSKFAHLLYRAAAMVYAEHTGRIREAQPPLPGSLRKAENSQAGIIHAQR